MVTTEDTRVPFNAFFIQQSIGRPAQRHMIADTARAWIAYCHDQGRSGCVIFDVDDTVVDGNEQSFDVMAWVFDFAKACYPVHVVTARPDTPNNRAYTADLLKNRKMFVPDSHLHMMNESDWETGDDRLVHSYKFNKRNELFEKEKGVVAFFDDKLYNLAHPNNLAAMEEYIHDHHAYMFWDSKLGYQGCFKMPGGKRR